MADSVKNESPLRAMLRRAPVIPVYGPASVDEAVRVGEALVRSVTSITGRPPRSSASPARAGDSRLRAGGRRGSRARRRIARIGLSFFTGSAMRR